MNKKEQLKNITVDIYELGMVRRDIENWEPAIDLGNEDLKRICTHLLILTDDEQTSFEYLKNNRMKFEEARSHLLKKHFEHLAKLREQLYAL